MKKRTAWILVAAVAAVAMGAAAVGVVALVLRGRGGSSAFGAGAGRSYLALELDGSIPEQPASDFGSLFERRPPPLRALVESLDRAASDPSVSALVVKVGMLPDAGWAKVQELRAAILRFRSSGKPAYAHIELCSNKEYYLATACTKIYAVPSAILDVSGLATEITFLRGSLDKLGVQAQFEGVGKYKNAPNQFTETGFTPPHREQMEAMLDSLFGEYLAAIAKGRSRSLDEARELIDRGPYDAQEAKRAGLVDDLRYRDQIEQELKDASRTTPARYLRAARPFFDTRPKIALVYAVGDIIPGGSQRGPFGGEYAGADTVSAAFRQAREDSSIRAVVFRVDSPGGFGPAADVMWREVAVTKRRKPVIVSMGDYAASGGYYVSMGADYVLAQPGTLTGSLGVFSGKFNLRGFYDKIGMSKELLARGKNALIYTEYRPWNEGERARIQTMNRAFYDDFVKRAAEGRKKSFEEIDAVAQGRVWTGAEALQQGLVDRLGGFGDAIEVAKQRAGIAKGQDVALMVLPARKGLLETLMERQEEGQLESALPEDVRATLRFLALLREGGPMARLPFELRVR
jgi:protease-4